MAEAGESTAQDTDAADAQEDGMEAEPWLVCESCKMPLVKQAEIIEEKFATWNAVVWPYELSVLDRESWCYSATNPGNIRFDIVRTLPSVVGRSIDRHGLPSPEHSWFPGFGWCMAHCHLCRKHLGWTFSPNPEPGQSTVAQAARHTAREIPQEASVSESSDGATAEQTEQAESGGTATNHGSAESGNDCTASMSATTTADPNDDIAFVGLILTSLREKDLKPSEVRERFQIAEETRSRSRSHSARGMFRRHFSRLPSSQEALRSALAEMAPGPAEFREALSRLREAVSQRRAAQADGGENPQNELTADAYVDLGSAALLEQQDVDMANVTEDDMQSSDAETWLTDETALGFADDDLEGEEAARRRENAAAIFSTPPPLEE
mmetsp:Transcript_69302/g.166155  ORF Transcript_69302/g.166155 Transcript_69302/m.166155 type:complete len:381 (+) Transcript_69302:109-1251(+)